MTGVTHTTSHRRSARPPRGAAAAVPPEVLAPKPWSGDDLARLHALAARLGGKPVPGLRMTPQQFEDWCDPNLQAEWVDGEIVLMTPETWHDATFVGRLFRILAAFVEERGLGEVAGREVLVRLPGQRRRRAPDMQFIAQSRLDIVRGGIVEGAPDLIVESVSHDSVVRDWQDKHAEYARAGVREYWVIDPASKAVQAYQLVRGKRFRPIHVVGDKITSVIVPGFYLRPKRLQAPKRPSVASVLRELGVRG